MRFIRGLSVIIALGSLASIAKADVPPVLFDFDSLGRFDRASQISDHMTAVYGSTVEVEGAVSAADVDDGDMFIATSFQLLNRGDFIINFVDVPILGVRFEGHVIDGTFGDDFVFRALNGSSEVTVFSRDDGETVFTTGWIDFGGPVDQLIVSDSGRKDVGIDDLLVQPVPEPATGLLMLAGLAILARRRAAA